MKFSVDRETLFKPLQAVQGVVERRQTLPILANVLLQVGENDFSITGTDMEIELVASSSLVGAEPGETTLPARKLVDICRSLPDGAKLDFVLEEDRAVVRSGRSRFTLATLPAADYPAFDPTSADIRITVKQADLKRLIELTHFAMAQQDVRYYLNGLLLEISTEGIKAVATDGHRLAVATLEQEIAELDEPRGLIVPRKGVSELLRLLAGGDETLEMAIAPNQIQILLGGVRFTSKLIDGKFPDYERVIPDPDKCDKLVTVERELLRQSLSRASILSNDKYRAIRLMLDANTLRLVANNPEQEQAEDEVEVAYEGDTLEIGFNVSYLIDALSILPSDTAQIHLLDASSSCLITPSDHNGCQYVVMPMRL